MNQKTNKVRSAIEAATATLEKGWAQYKLARDIEGYSASVTSPYAVEFCAIGALERHFYDQEGATVHQGLTSQSLNTLDAATAAIELFVPNNEHGFPVSLSRHNDHPERTQSEMVALFRKAI